MCLGGGGGDDFLREEYERQKAEEEARQARITEGKAAIDKAFAGYDDDFYAQRAADYMAYAQPQIEDQYKRAMKDLTIALARSGQLVGSEAIERGNELKKKLADAETQAAMKGQSMADTTRTNLANLKSNLLTQNASLADPSLIASTAANSIMANTAVPEYNPIANIFANATEGLATQAQLEARNKNRYEMAQLFAPVNSSTIIRG
tara:strand:- start:10450 stop:11067 length:618 start_codon:yes stop_codon:yes gene_type:complete